MRQLVTFVCLLACATAIAESKKYERRDDSKDAHTVAPELIPTTVDYKCALGVLNHEKGRGWRAFQTLDFSGTSDKKRNSYTTDILIGGDLFRFLFTYNKLGSIAFESDPMDGESASIHLYPKKAREDVGRISSIVSSHGMTELPSFFSLREPFMHEHIKYILNVKCTTVKTFEPKSV